MLSIKQFFFLCGVIILGAPPVHAENFKQTCTYYANIAFNDLHTGREETLRVLLARDCADARSVLASDAHSNADRARAHAYLTQLHRYRQTLIQMANDRFEHARNQNAPSTRHLSGRVVARGVSPTGAYLIAHRMGLIDTHSDWQAWRQALVLE